MATPFFGGISAPDGRRYLNMGFKMTGMVEFMGTEGSSEASNSSVFAYFAKNGVARAAKAEYGLSQLLMVADTLIWGSK